jgi:hypothetical protein
MPIQVTSNFIPKSGQRWFLLEDKYLKGGFRVVADIASRNYLVTDSQSATGLKVGMLVLTADTGITWKYEGTNVWSEYKPNALFTYTQATPSDTWLIAHNKNSENFVYSIFDDQGYSIIPDGCQRIDANNIAVTFSTSIAGRATFSFNL